MTDDRKVQYTLLFPISLKEWIEAEALKRSAVTGEKVSTADVVRDAVAKLKDAA